jgi:hypothetical protein
MRFPSILVSARRALVAEVVGTTALVALIAFVPATGMIGPATAFAPELFAAPGPMDQTPAAQEPTYSTIPALLKSRGLDAT